MRIDPAQLTLAVAVQSVLMGALLVSIASGNAGKAPWCLRMRGAAMLLQGVGYVLISLRGRVDPFWSVMASFGLVASGHAMTLIALRALLGLREHRLIIVAAVFGAWLCLLRLTFPSPDKQASAMLSQIYSVAYAIAVSWPIWRRLFDPGSIGERIWLCTAMFMASTQLWLLISASPPLESSAGAAVMILSTLMPTLTGIAFLTMYNEAVQGELRNLARIDPLTGINNRRAIIEHLERSIRRVVHDGDVLSILIVDVDYFKSVNDRFGHAAGDTLLTNVAQRLKTSIGCHDAVGRLGGDELLVVAHAADLNAGVNLANKLRDAIAQISLSVHGEHLAATISVGVASTIFAQDLGMLLDHADKALYKAKREGRNRVQQWTPSFASL